MSPGAPWRIILVAEGPSDQRRVSLLIDYFLQKNAAAGTPLNELRRFEGLGGEPYEEQKDMALIWAVDSGSPASSACGLHAFRKEVEAWLSCGA